MSIFGRWFSERVSGEPSDTVYVTKDENRFSASENLANLLDSKCQDVWVYKLSHKQRMKLSGINC
jgi:hypothetical protein